MKPGSWSWGRLVAGASLGMCIVLLLLFAVLSYSAVLGKSATYDEPLHAVGGYVHRTMGDFRINPEDPALFGYLGSLPHGSNSLKINKDFKSWDEMIDDFATNQWTFVWLTLYRTPENDAKAFLNKSRFMFVIVGVMLGALIAWWSWQLAGAAAGIIATAFFALDPNFMAHTALVKNDVMLSLLWSGLAMALWRFGQRGTWLSLFGIAIACAAAVNVKFSGVLSGPIIFLVLLVRALLPRQWIVLGYALKTRWSRLILAVPLVCATAGVVAYTAIWACYGFRFCPTSDPKAVLNTPRLIERARHNLLRVRQAKGEQITQEIIDQQKPGALVDAIVWVESKQLLPQPWSHGFLYTYATSLYRGSFLMGELSATGWWYYFPCAMLFKTPTATLLAALIALAVAAGCLQKAVDWWPIVCLALPAWVYGVIAMSTNLNLGLRHILPVYPFIFVALGVAFALLVDHLPRIGGIAAGLLVLGVAGESWAAYPNFIAFFNSPCGGSRGGLRFLGDSNLDWGQDLPLLANWQTQHTDRPLYLAYFGIAEPEYYGVKAKHLPPAAGGWPFASSVYTPSGTCYLAVSATNLQGIYIDPRVCEDFRKLLEYEPMAVLGGSIYLYDFPPKETSRKR